MPIPRIPRADVIKQNHDGEFMVDRLNYRDSAAIVAAANAAAAVYAAASPAQRAGRPNALREELRVHQDAYYALRQEYRDLGVARGERNAAGMINIVSHISGDGVPDTSTPAGEAYWSEVQRAADQGVPNAVGFQR